jgi:hypothetical protein
VNTLTERLQKLADHPEIRVSMGAHGLEKIKKIGGWNAYGEKAMVIYDEVLKS